MTFHFTTIPLDMGLYEPEGIYLGAPFDGVCPILQFWGDNPEFHKQFFYNNIPIKGHLGLDFKVSNETKILATDDGRVVEVSYEHDGFEHYIKLEHTWGESFYAQIGKHTVESGQKISRGQQIGIFLNNHQIWQPHLHFGIRVLPYNRFDGWGGFTDPLPFLDSECIAILKEEDALVDSFEIPKMVKEKLGMRRP